MDSTAFAAFAATSRPAAVAQKQRAAYNEQAVLSATPVQLVTMLYDRLMLDLGRAEQAQLVADWAGASEQLLHAQAIIAELSSSLKVDVWDGGEGLLALYNYTSTGLVTANVHHDVALTREVVGLLEPLRQAWHDAAASLQAGGAAGVPLPAPASPGAAVPGAGLPQPAGVAAFGSATSGYGATIASSSSLGGALGVA
jgi:flagellar protein FliS